MSDKFRDDNNNLNVDPRLDALLSRALSRGSVPRQQRQRHLERLGIAPHLGGSASMWRAPVVAGRPPSSTSPQPASFPARRRQWLEVCAAVLAVVLVGALLVALFRDWSGGEDDQQLAASPEATSPAVTATSLEPLLIPTPEPTAHERLFAISHIVSTGGDIVGGRVTAYDAETAEIAYWIDTGQSPDAILSPDGTRLFVAANSEDGDTLSSYDAVSGDRNWSVSIEHRHIWQFGEGPTALAVSQDGSRLFVYSASAPGDYTIQVFDTADGRLGRVIDGVAGCTAQLFPAADGRTLYVVCLNESAAPQVIDLEAWTSAGVMQGFGGVITGAAATSDGRYLYIPHDIDSELRLTVVHMNERTISTQRDIVHMASDPLHSLNITAVSPDGSRLFIGLGSESGEGGPAADEVWAWNTAVLHDDPSREILREGPITGWSLAPAPDNRSVFAIHNQNWAALGYSEPSGATILRVTIDGDGDTETFATRPDWQVLRLFSGRVNNTPEPPSTDEPEPAPSTPPDSTSVCPTTPWADLEGRDVNLLPEAYWIEGDGLALGHLDGRLVEGENALAWVVDSPGIVDPDTSARVMMRGTRVGTSYGGSVPLELRDYAIEYNAVIDGGVEHHIDSTFIFPTYGCWQIEAEFGSGWVRAVVYVEPDYSVRNPAMIWDVLRWRPLHELGIDPTPPCLRMAPQQVIDGLGPLLGDMQTNGGPVYLSGLDENGAIRIDIEPLEDGSYYAQVSFVTSGDYTGPLLVRPSPGGGTIGFSSVAPFRDPPGEWHLQDPADIHPTGGVRQWWPVYLRLVGPGCHALQIDGLDFSSIIVFEVLAEDGA